jgi:tRNA nucleotidyltransferase (CCA-adding enzyme)
MEIIVTHEMADFDAMAAAVAAQKLHPDTTILLSHHLGTQVRAFVNLHRNRFRTAELNEVDLRSVSRVIFVDVRRASRLAHVAPLLARARDGDPGLAITVYDHHAAAPDDVDAQLAIVEPVGSATTLLVERIRSRDLTLDEVEATLFSLGIHEDTGSLTYAATTARDAEALAWLLGVGANLRVLARYLKVGLGRAQRTLLARVLDAAVIERVGGVEVAIAIVPLAEHVADAAEVVTRALDLEQAGAFFVLLPIGARRMQVIARSRTPLVDVGVVLRAVGGGGHSAAGSGVIHDGDAQVVRQRLLDALSLHPPAATSVYDVMTSPVHTVSEDLALGELTRLLAAWRATGAPVTRGGALVGVISRRDIDRAKREGRLDASVARFMTREPLTTFPGEALEVALQRMSRADIGRLPVLRDGELIGILTRTDLIRALYQRDG